MAKFWFEIRLDRGDSPVAIEQAAYEAVVDSYRDWVKTCDRVFNDRWPVPVSLNEAREAVADLKDAITDYERILEIVGIIND